MIRLILPENLFDPLFADIALSGVLRDGKSLADAIPKFSVDKINDAYQKQKLLSEFNPGTFMDEHFIFSSAGNTDFVSDISATVQDHVNRLWPFLTRKADNITEGSTLIPLPYPYIVPGGRFNEIYYWDSYFTMLGLQISGKYDLIEQMINNFEWLIHKAGFIPNGNRTYFLSRSQPPFFSLMVTLLADIKGNGVYEKYLPALEKEYNFWMTSDGFEGNNSSHHCVNIDGTNVMNRYWDELDTPRTEMYADDSHMGQNNLSDAPMLFKNLRCACESGWDFSSRWCKTPNDLYTIHTSEILPVDLNCLLFHLEKTIAKSYRIIGQQANAEIYNDKANIRQSLINQYFWNEKDGYYYDFDVASGKQKASITLAGIFPLTFGLSTDKQAINSLQFMEKHLLKDGGLVTTTIQSGQQWDAPNGWAPLQYMAWKAAMNYHREDIAITIAQRWTKMNQDVFRTTGKMMEKYNVIDIGLESGGGEYPVQDGFGWTNGVYLAFKDWLETNS
jgi:alpha,alpha-trehalase